jgi:predicted RecB family nuclease
MLNLKETVTKSDWLAAEQCLGMAWYGLRRGSTAPNEAELFHMEQGLEIGRRARELYPNGIVVAKRDGRSSAEITQELIADPSIETLFEAGFQVSPFVARADILKRQGKAWHVLEVKSNFSDTSEIKDLIDDLAFTVMVLRQAGLPVARASLVFLSRDYRFGDGTDRLFEAVDKTTEVSARATEFEEAADSVARVLFDQTQPIPALVSACRSCAVYEDECLGSGLAHTVLELTGLHHTKLKRLSADGVIDLSRVPDDLKLNALQERVKRSVLSGKTVVEPGLGTVLESVNWPCHYLDFETVATFLPLYEGHGCHRQVLTQFSLHHRDSIDDEPRHSEYLAEATKDCERELAEALIERLGDRGSIIVYSHFEKTRIKALLDAFPDLAERLQAILDRLTDLLPIIRDHVYHPDFRGSFSIKKVLPVLVPELSYAGLDVTDGETAITRFARMARGEISGDDVEVIRRQLLDYCKLDTFAMVRLHETLGQLAAGR